MSKPSEPRDSQRVKTEERLASVQGKTSFDSKKCIIRPPASAFQSSKSFWLLQNWNVHPIPRFFYGEKSCLIFLLQIKARVTTLRLFSSFLHTRNALNSAKGWTHSKETHKWLLHMLHRRERNNEKKKQTIQFHAWTFVLYMLQKKVEVVQWQ